MKTSIEKLSSRSALWFDDLPMKLEEAVKKYSLPDSAEWRELEGLSSNTLFEGIDVSSDAIVRMEKTSLLPQRFTSN